MLSLGSYILSITAAGILLGLLSSFFDDKSATGGIIKMVGGLFLLIAVLKPIVGFRFDRLIAYTEQSFLDGEVAAEEGANRTRDAMAEIITEQTAAYILDKAAQLGADLQVSIFLTGDDIPSPDQVTLQGTYTSATRLRLEEIIETQLGIPKECQTWIGTP